MKNVNILLESDDVWADTKNRLSKTDLYSFTSLSIYKQNSKEF